VQLAGSLTAHDAGPAVDMALALAGSASELRRRPLLSLCAAGGEALDAALVFAGRGLPVGVVTSLTRPTDAAAHPAGAAPADLAAAVTLANASVLAALTVVQLAAPGAPFFYVCDPGLFGWVEALRGAPGGRPAQAGLISGAGLLGGGRVFSLQQLIMDSEIYSVAAKIAAGITIDDDTIALETIEKVGIGGNYLSERHTRAHMRTVWRPRLLDRTPWDSWVQGGRKGSYDKATELLHSILENHQAAAPGALQAAELRHIVEIADHGKEIK
jgi:trimethylamine--corrinoid protein Co-methyltransferase